MSDKNATKQTLAEAISEAQAKATLPLLPKPRYCKAVVWDSQNHHVNLTGHRQYFDDLTLTDMCNLAKDTSRNGENTQLKKSTWNKSQIINTIQQNFMMTYFCEDTPDAAETAAKNFCNNYLPKINIETLKTGFLVVLSEKNGEVETCCLFNGLSNIKTPFLLHRDCLALL